jgi:hypothetical protein
MINATIEELLLQERNGADVYLQLDRQLTIGHTATNTRSRATTTPNDLDHGTRHGYIVNTTARLAARDLLERVPFILPMPDWYLPNTSSSMSSGPR